MIITIDGPAGAGKSTAARMLAVRLELPYLDTGAMYRVVTLAALRSQVDLADEAALAGVARHADWLVAPTSEGVRVTLDGVDVGDAIRSMRVNEHTHYVAASPGVRATLIERQRQIADELGSLVTEGRDQGTAAFPHADVKFFVSADLETRAQRRLAELPETEGGTLAAVRRNLLDRDRTDATRSVAPLLQPDDAVVINTSALSMEEVVEVMVGALRRKGLHSAPQRDG